MWIGNACLTGSGRRLVVMYGPRTFTNNADLFARGGFTAVVDLRTGVVTKLPVRGSLAYFSPGCGTGEKAVVSQFGGKRADDPAVKRLSSRLIVVDAAKGTAGKPILLRTEVFSPVPVGDAVVAAGPGRLVRVGANGALTGWRPRPGWRSGSPRTAPGRWCTWIAPASGCGSSGPCHGAAPAATLAEGPADRCGPHPGRGRPGVPDRHAVLGEVAAGRREAGCGVPAASALSSTGAVALTRRLARPTDPRAPVTEPGAARPVGIAATSVAGRRGARVHCGARPERSARVGRAGAAPDAGIAGR